MNTPDTVLASEFTRNFVRYRMRAHREPVAVSSHGQITGYFVGPDEYEGFKRFRESRRSFATVELPEKRSRRSAPRAWIRDTPISTSCSIPNRPEVTNGPFLPHKGTERERRSARIAEFRRKRRLNLRTTLSRTTCFPTGSATTLQIAENWRPIVSLGNHASPVPPMSAYA